MNVFVTGGANGIGRATVDILHEDHAVVVYDIDDDALDDLPAGVEAISGDVRDGDAVRDALAGRDVDVLVNDAGFQARGAVEDMEMDTVREHIDTNVYGALHTIRAALPTLRERDGRIVNVSSLAGRVSAPTWGPYAASKHAVEALSDALRMELRPFDVDVVVVEPGAVRTGFNERGRAYMERFLPDSVYADRYEHALDGDMGGISPEKAARTVVTAVETDRPRARYPVTWQARIAPRLKCLLPTTLFDRLVERY